jgi:hypothetical protein
MNNTIYKYSSPNYLDNIFASNEHVTLKCSYPKDFNDPYELFLTIDFDEHPELLAFYAETIGELPQIPTTCFSLSPSVIPMWAHYAQNQQGFVIAFDEELLVKEFPKSGFGNVDCQDGSHPHLTELLHNAFLTKKPRHTYFLQEGVFSAAYYTKATCWNYEKERRMLVREDETRQAGDLILIDIPNRCVQSLICGAYASDETLASIKNKANQLGCNFYHLKIGKSSVEPFMIDSNGVTNIFNGSNVEPCQSHCKLCKEPIKNGASNCSWCQISDSHRINAALSNPQRILAAAGMLGFYIESAEAIRTGGRRS